MLRLIAQIAGLLITLEAWRQPSHEERDVFSDLSDTVSFAYNHVEEYYDEKERDFEKEVKKRRVLLSIPNKAPQAA